MSGTAENVVHATMRIATENAVHASAAICKEPKLLRALLSHGAKKRAVESREDSNPTLWHLISMVDPPVPTGCKPSFKWFRIERKGCWKLFSRTHEYHERLIRNPYLPK